MDSVKLAQTSELVARRHSRWSSSSWTVWMVYNPAPKEDSCMGCHVLLYDWFGNHSRYVPSLLYGELD